MLIRHQNAFKPYNWSYSYCQLDSVQLSQNGNIPHLSFWVKRISWHFKINSDIIAYNIPAAYLRVFQEANIVRYCFHVHDIGHICVRYSFISISALEWLFVNRKQTYHPALVKSQGYRFELRKKLDQLFSQASKGKKRLIILNVLKFSLLKMQLALVFCRKNLTSF